MAKLAPSVSLAEGGDDDVGRRADQRHHAAEDGGEAKRHQRQAGLRPALADADSSTGISRASAATLFMKADSARRSAAMMAMWLDRLRPVSTSVRTIQATAPELIRPAGDDQHQRDDDRRRVAEAGEGLLRRHDAGDDGDDQGAEGDEVVAEAAPDQEREDAGEQARTGRSGRRSSAAL